MIIYADTSALAKIYLAEAESDAVQKILAEAETVWASPLTHLELVSAIETAKRTRRINSPMYRDQCKSLDADLRMGILTLLDINPTILHRAVSLIRIRSLKAPDAIQLATAIEAKKRSYDIDFLCADQSLLAAARKEGLRCRDVSA